MHKKIIHGLQCTWISMYYFFSFAHITLQVSNKKIEARSFPWPELAYLPVSEWTFVWQIVKRSSKADWKWNCSNSFAKDSSSWLGSCHFGGKLSISASLSWWAFEHPHGSIIFPIGWQLNGLYKQDNILVGG